ncbi:unnamed protein product [Rotaria sp. Silwood2]|nr:unnamed protein product [Rotaria sp. Silwood2]CAF3107129.1 unnamed protein product [Rotaria sp. Silwood2]CAF4063285.1 unnamed protein product [Rotaria sp. Silwood2]CAF4125237.1 unnamed protein product [Rotaria sp. Silwood2]
MIAMVHDNPQLPLIDSAGMALATEFKHRITYTKKIISYLRSPYSTCNDKILPVMLAMLDNYQGAKYGYSEDMLRIMHSTAHVFLTSSYLLEKYCSYCPQQCFVTNFNIKPSLWKTPPTWLMDDIKTFLENSEIPLSIDWPTNWRSHIDSSYLSVELVYESTLIENYTQIATMTAVDALPNVGGQTGLWIGVSFLSIMELAEILY